MGLMCKVLGHEPERAYGGGQFFQITAPYHDGCGRPHRDLWSKCERCGKKFYVGRTIDQELSEKEANNQAKRPT